MFRLFLLLSSCCLLLACSEPSFHPDSFDGDYGFKSDEEINEWEVELGKSLFFDRILSGNKNISCATCHHPSVASADALSLSIGEGGKGIGKDRVDGEGDEASIILVPRNSPALFNLGSSHITALFHDGRVEMDDDYPNGFRSPARSALPVGLNDKLAVQAMFPVTSVVEMAGVGNENEIGRHAENRDRFHVWHEIADRVRYIGQYALAFKQVYGIGQEEIEFTDIANAIGAFVDVDFRSINSPFDRYINGDESALSGEQLEGLTLFYGKAKCASCHAGVFQMDNAYHSIGLPQVGPGKRGGWNIPVRYFSDFGRELVTGNPDDRYKFKTPSLRNVELTSPYGHDGAYTELEDIVLHHLEPEKMMMAYDCKTALSVPYRKLIKNFDCKLMEDESQRKEILASSDLPAVSLSEDEVVALLAFLRALTDDSMRDRKDQVPESVLSGLPVND